MSAYTKTQLCNMALSHCGIAPSISDIESDDTNEAINCRLWYDTALGALMEMVPWPFAQEEKVATLLERDPNERWLYSYLYPNDIARINAIVNQTMKRVENTKDKIKYVVKRAPDGNGKVIWTDEDAALFDVNISITDTSQFDDTFAMAFSLLLATYISKPLRVKAAIKADIQADWTTWLSEAQVQNKSEREDGEMPDSEFVTGRM